MSGNFWEFQTYRSWRISIEWTRNLQITGNIFIIPSIVHSRRKTSQRGSAREQTSSKQAIKQAADRQAGKKENKQERKQASRYRYISSIYSSEECDTLLSYVHFHWPVMSSVSHMCVRRETTSRIPQGRARPGPTRCYLAALSDRILPFLRL